MTDHDNQTDTASGTDDTLAVRTDRQIRSVIAQLAECDRDLEALAEERIEGLHGESFTAEAADDLAEQHEQTIRADINRGVLKHTPATKGQLRLARLAPFADFLVFLYFLAVIFNADWANPLSTPVQAVLALVLAVIATAGVAWTLRSIAARYRQEKPDDNRFPWRRRSRQSGVQLDRALLVLILAGVGVMMFYRIYTDARESALGFAASLLVAVFFSLITVALNYVIFMVEYSNGSTTTDELRHLRVELEPIEKRISAIKRRRRELQQRLDTLRRTAIGTTVDPVSALAVVPQHRPTPVAVPAGGEIADVNLDAHAGIHRAADKAVANLTQQRAGSHTYDAAAQHDADARVEHADPDSIREVLHTPVNPHSPNGASPATRVPNAPSPH